MKMKHLFCAAALAVWVCAMAETSTPRFWTENLDEALARAKESGRLVLVDFSGSDWCGWCRKLDQEVFSTPEFLAEATNKYELVFIDTPNDKNLLSEIGRAHV